MVFSVIEKQTPSKDSDQCLTLFKLRHLSHSNIHTVEQYLQLFQQGDETGLDHFFHKFYRPLCLFAEGYVSRMDIAEDIVSNTFLKTWKRHSGFTSEGSLKSFLYITVKNACLDHLKTEKRKPRLPTPPTENRSMLDNMIRAEVLHEVYLAIEQLPGQCRSVFTKLFIEDKTAKETAEEMQLSVSTIKAQKARALLLIRKKISFLILLFCLCRIVY